MTEETVCVFCKSDFPSEYQLISDKPKYWFFISNRNPQTDYHCMIIFKSNSDDEQGHKIGHIQDLNDDRLPPDAMSEFGILLQRACIAIKASDDSIERVLIASLNTGKGTQHLHFHLLPKRKQELIRTVHKPDEDGSGMFFLARKEIVVDTFSDFVESVTGDLSAELVCKIKEATRKRVAENTIRLKRNFKWNSVFK